MTITYEIIPTRFIGLNNTPIFDSYSIVRVVQHEIAGHPATHRIPALQNIKTETEAENIRRELEATYQWGIEQGYAQGYQDKGVLG